MAMIMDMNGSDPLQANSTAAKFFSPESLSYHGCEASTSDNLRRTSTDIYDSRYIGELSSAPCISVMCSEAFEATQENDRLYRSYDIDDRNTHHCPRSAPGPTSCVFLEMALKRLYAKDDFDVLESLGEGFFGDVYKVRHRTTGEVMVLKVGKERERENRTRVKANVLKEVDVLNQLTSHPNLLAFRGVCVDSAMNSWNLHILMDYCDAGSLSRLICDHQKCFPWRLRCSLARDISYAMNFVHSKDIMHRDLTSMNVLLQTVASGSLKAVVADFGLSCKIPRAAEKLIQVGTPYWMAPECLKEEFYDEKADLFSFGVILCQMIARIDADPEAGLYRTHNFGLDHVRFTAHCPADTPLEILSLAFQCCMMDPAARPSFESVCKFFVDFPLLRQKDCDESTLQTHFVESDGRLGRSLSDATLRSSKSKQSELFPCVSTQKEQSIRSQSDCKSANVVPLLVLQEGVLCEDLIRINKDEEMKKKSQMEELARSVAVDELSDEASLDTGNPFMEHEVYKTARKLAFPELNDRRKRVVSEAKDSNSNGRESAIIFNNDLADSNDLCGGFSYGASKQAGNVKRNDRPNRISKNLVRRSRSLPGSSADFSRISWKRDHTTFDPLLPSSSSAGLTPATATDIGEQCALKGQMSMAFKNEDQKFASRRYPSRRYTVLSGTLLSGDAVEERRATDFSLSVDEAILSRNIDELTFEHWKSDGDFPTSHEQGNDVVMQQPFPVLLVTSESSEGTSGTRTVLFPKEAESGNFSNVARTPRKSANKKCHAQVKRDTVVLATNKKSVPDDAVTLDPFCVGGRKCSSCRKQRLAQADDSTHEYVPPADYCTIL